MSGTKLLLFRLPKSLLVQFLSEWLDIHDVGKLDTAMTNKKHRSEFLQCLNEMRNQTVPVSFDGSLGHDTDLLSWISIRQIHVQELSLTSFHEKREFIEGLHLPSLQKLEVESQFSDCPPWLRHVPHLSPSLEELSVGQFGTMAAIKTLIFVLSQCLELTSVCIDYLIFQARDCTDDVLAELQEFGHLIVEIRKVYGYKRNVTTEGFKNFIRCCPRLRKLGYSHFDDNGALLKCVAQLCPLLEDITFDTWSKPVLLDLSRNCKQLRKVGLHDAEVVASDLGLLKQVDTLEELSISDCGVTNETLAMISGFRHLKHLELQEHYGIDGLTGAGFSVLEGSPISETLESISVTLWETLDGLIPVQDFDKAEMTAGIASCHNLRKVDLMNHCLCDDAGLVILGAGCPLLEEIELTYGPVTVNGLVALAEHCRHLTKVVLFYDFTEGRDLEAEEHEYFDISPIRARAVAGIAIVRSRLPNIRFEYGQGWDDM